MKGRLLIVLCLFCLPLQAEPFHKTYSQESLAVVLLEIEEHFGCSFLYRPQDIAVAPAVSGSFDTDDCNEVLRQVLGKELVVTPRKNILIITPAPKKAAVSKPVKPVVVVAPDTIVNIRVRDEQPDTVKEEEVLLPEEFLRPDELVFYAHIDTFLIARSVCPAVIDSTLPLVSQAMAVANSVPEEVKPAKKKPQRYGPYMFRHAFQGTGRIGYGSEYHTTVDLRYTYFFLEHWGIGAGMNFTYGFQYDPDRNYNTIIEEGRVCLPIAVYTQWMFTDKWGLQASAGIEASFPATSTFITKKNADGIAVASVLAAHPFSSYGIVLLGIYTDISVTGVSPWSAGFQFGVRLGK